MTIKTEQVDIKDLETITFNLVLVASGYESRGNFLFNSNLHLKANSKISIGFENYLNEPIRKYNDSFFENLAFKSIISSGNNSEAIIVSIDEFLKTCDAIQEIRILIDYSCMTRVWYADILKHLLLVNSHLKIQLYFSYSVSSYLDPPETSPINKFVDPIEGFYSISVPMNPTAVLIGLGYVSSRAFGLAEYFDVTPYLFINDSNFNAQFHDEVVAQNAELISSVPEENVFYYPLNNLVYTETLLHHLCLDLLNNYRIVLAPCGPKPFTLLSLITSLKLDNVDVWRISAGENEAPVDKKASGTILVLKCMVQS